MIGTLALIILALALICFLWKQQASPKSFPPGPSKYPLLGSILSMQPPDGSKPNIFWGIIALQKKFGSIIGVHLGPLPTVILTTYEDIKYVFSLEEAAHRPGSEPVHKLRKGWQGPMETDPILNQGRMSGVIGTNGRFWKEQRRYLLRTLRDFGFGKNSMEDGINDEVQKMIEFLKNNQGQAIELNKVTNICMLNCLWSMLVGEKLPLNDPKLNQLVDYFDELFRQGGGPTSILANIIPYPDMLLWPFIKQVTGLCYAENAFGNCVNFVAPYVDQHKESFDESHPRDIIDMLLLEIQRTTDPSSSFYGQRGEDAIVNNLVDLFLAGMETTASSVLWAIVYCLHFPDFQDKIHLEIDEIIGRDRKPSLDDQANMHFVNAFLLEALRMTSYVPMSVFHHANADIQIKDFVIPKGAMIISSLWHVMHDPQHFKNPSEFQPQRFLDSNGHYVEDNHVIPFGLGKRLCIGQSLAKKEYFLFMTGLLQRFKFINPPGVQPPKYGVEDVPVTGLTRSIPEFKVIILPRES